MLSELSISNLAVIEDAAIQLGPGLNVFTGQTGAGKSLVLGAIETLLGLRKNPARMIRPGASQARISGLFQPTHETAADIASALDLELEPGEPVLLTRKLHATGRSSLSANGQPVTAAMMRRAAGHLVDIHSQHDHQFLLKPANQLAVLDTFAKCDRQREKFSERFTELRKLEAHREELAASSDLRRQQLELYRFQADEIDTADPIPGEMIELQQREKVLVNLQKIKGDASNAHAALYEAEGSICERLQAATHVLLSLAELDEGLSTISDQVRCATLSLQESSFELGRYLGNLELNPAELEEVQSRLNVLNRLLHKYGDGRRYDDPLEPLLSQRKKLAEEIDRLEAQTQSWSSLDARIEVLAQELDALGGALSEKRGKAGKALGPRIARHLKELGMPEARLWVELSRCSVSDSAAGPRGLDTIEFMAQTNPGQAARPLREIASGGEMSRIMLALKSEIVASAGVMAAGQVSVLVFDEIDANIGGRLGHVIGQKLRDLAGTKDKQAQGQVLCITHLPQIAAFADRHFHIVKRVEGKGKAKQTKTTVDQLEGKDRVDELAEMMSGRALTSASRKQAREMIASAVAA